MHIKIEGRRMLTLDEEKLFIQENRCPGRVYLKLYIGLLDGNYFLADYLQAAAALVNRNFFWISRGLLLRCREDFKEIITSGSEALVEQFFSEVTSVPDSYLAQMEDDYGLFVEELSKAIVLLDRCLTLPVDWDYQITIVE